MDPGASHIVYAEVILVGLNVRYTNVTVIQRGENLRILKETITPEVGEKP